MTSNSLGEGCYFRGDFGYTALDDVESDILRRFSDLDSKLNLRKEDLKMKLRVDEEH